MAKETTIPYQVAFVYNCQICKKGHTEFGRIMQPSVAITHREELKRNLLRLIEEKFSTTHPQEEFDLDNLAIEEIVDGNRTEVDPRTIKPREVIGEDLTIPLNKSTKKKDAGLEDKELLSLPPLGFVGIKAMLDAKMVELKKQEKEVDAQIKEAIKKLKELTAELADLEKLKEAAEKIHATKVKEKKK